VAIEISAPTIDRKMETVDQSNPGRGGATPETIGGEPLPPTMTAMHFVLVHGAYHGAWCWDLLRRDLEADGHSTSAVDLPNEDPGAGAERYADEILAVVPKTPAGIVLVGHSLAGLTIPIVAARTNTRMAIYLCALLPVPGLSFDAQHADLDTGFRPSKRPVENADGSVSWPARGAVEIFYQDCDPQTAAASARQLRPQQWRITQEVTPLRAWPAVRSAYIMCADDRAIPRMYSTHAARQQLRVEAIEMPGGHSPFLSRPKELAAQLSSLASQ
jgi:pimeloyl-ACP methyl ester carboxylesterase